MSHDGARGCRDGRGLDRNVSRSDSGANIFELSAEVEVLSGGNKRTGRCGNNTYVAFIK